MMMMRRRRRGEERRVEEEEEEDKEEGKETEDEHVPCFNSVLDPPSDIYLCHELWFKVSLLPSFSPRSFKTDDVRTVDASKQKKKVRFNLASLTFFLTFLHLFSTSVHIWTSILYVFSPSSLYLLHMYMYAGLYVGYIAA